MSTRRIRGQQFLLRPDDVTEQVVGYVVGVMQKRWGIAVHALAVMGNHWHVVSTDPHGHVVEFERDCHHFIAKALNAYHGESESIWANTQGSRVPCREPGDVIGRIAYTMANPVAAGLVRHGHSWPGLRRAWPAPPRVYRKPWWYFRGADDGGDWPDETTLEMTRPPGYEALSDEQLAALIEGAIEAREEEERREHDAAGRPFLGRRAARKQPRHAQPWSRGRERRQGGREASFRLSPGRRPDKWRGRERRAASRIWLADYREALARWRAGDRTTVFPAGTYLMRVVHGARCAGPPD